VNSFENVTILETNCSVQCCTMYCADSLISSLAFKDTDVGPWYILGFYFMVCERWLSDYVWVLFNCCL